MKYFKYLIVCMVLVLLHLLLSTWLIIVMWCCMGIALPFLWKENRQILPVILLLEIIAATVLLFFKTYDGQLDQLAHHASLSSVWLMTAIVLVNVITAFLCISTTSLISRWVIRRKNH